MTGHRSHLQQLDLATVNLTIDWIGTDHLLLPATRRSVDALPNSDVPDVLGENRRMKHHFIERSGDMIPLFYGCGVDAASSGIRQAARADVRAQL